ncbi:YfhO family protein [Bacillus sp. 03113]|uniref:YfhO family protein n=1 Tax=Bacillus sp. 03113 TaxID=2578211 RepID=UPI00114339AD|nr:YfhO family protein [Bacillus sp. 03113]
MYKFTVKYSGYFSSFLLPFMLLGFVFVVYRIYPFGDRSILMADQFTQYIQFYNHFYDVFKGNASLLYTWELGMGLNFWGTFAYYLSSPISFVVLLFDRDHLPEAFVCMTMIKIGLMGLTMYLYISNMFQFEKIPKLIFSTLFALCSFSIGYFFNIMWLDSLYLLPVVLLGVEYLFRKKYLVFIISLALLFISNFYMAYIVGFFTFLYFVYRSYVHIKISMNVFIKNFLAFILCTAVAGGISAFLTVPTYILLKSNTYQPIQWNGLFKVSFGFFEFIAKLYNGSTQLFNMPNVFSGVIVLLLAPLFFILSSIHRKEKIVLFILLCFLLLSFQWDGLNIIWHAFEKPTGYLQRFAFVFSFLLIYLSIKAYLLFDRKNVPSLFKIYLVHVLILMLLTKLTPELMSVRKALLNIFLLTVFSLLLYGKAEIEKHSRLFTIGILFFACADVSINTYSHLQTLNSNVGYSYSRNQYNIQAPGFQQLINETSSKDKDFYRMTSLIRLTPNDSIRYGFKGMSNFNTLSNGTLHDFLHALGYSTTLGARSLAQNKGILSSDSLFGFKYMMTDQPVQKQDYKKVKCIENTCLYQNENAMPLGFLMDPRQFHFSHEDQPFEKQNQLLGPIQQKRNYFTPVKIDSVQYHNLEVNQDGTTQHVKKLIPEQEGSIEMTFQLEGRKQFYLLLDAGKGFPGFNETIVYINGESLGVYPTYHNERVLDLGAFSNEQVKVKIEFLVPETQIVQQMYYALDIPMFEQRINQIKQESFKVTKWTETSINGKINVLKRNHLFLSIPYDKGWEAKVDGSPVQIVKLGGFIGIEVDKGVHQVELSYTPKGFVAGWVITILSLFILFGYYFFRKKYEIQKD